MNRQKIGLVLFSVCAVIFVLSSLYDNQVTQFDLSPSRLKFPNFQSLGFLSDYDDNDTNVEILSTSTVSQLIPNTTHRELTTTIPTTLMPNIRDVSKCVPNYKIMQENGERNQEKTPFLLLAAYEYTDHIVVTLQADGWNGSPVFCRYLDENLKEVGSPITSSVLVVSAVHCCHRKDIKYMSVTLNETEPVKQWTALNDRTMSEPTYNLSLCLAPIYGDESKWLLLAETIEHYRLQGVQHYYLYIKDMDTYSRYLVEDYVRSGEIEVIWLEYRKDRPLSEWQLFGVHDCLQRARFHSRYAIFADLDERITPSKNETLLDLVSEEFGKDKKVGGIRFRPRWILRNKPVPKVYQSIKTVNESLPTLVFHNTSHWPGVGHTAKMILDPKKVLVMWVHYVTQYVPGYTTAEIPPERAVIRHYRDISAGDWGKLWYPETAAFGKYEDTAYPSELMIPLYRNIVERLQRVYTEKLPVP